MASSEVAIFQNSQNWLFFRNSQKRLFFFADILLNLICFYLPQTFFVTNKINWKSISTSSSFISNQNIMHTLHRSAVNRSWNVSMWKNVLNSARILSFFLMNHTFGDINTYIKRKKNMFSFFSIYSREFSMFAFQDILYWFKFC